MQMPADDMGLELSLAIYHYCRTY